MTTAGTPQGADINLFESRKRDHIRHALDARNQVGSIHSGIEQIRLPHEALPDFNFAEISLATTRWGQACVTPFYISAMTAGHPGANDLNRVLARAASRRGWAMGVGSQRRELNQDDSDVGLDRWSILREEAPGLTLFGNLGIAQLITTPVDKMRRLIDALEADALVIHLNALQEILQPEGTPQFKGGLTAIAALVQKLGDLPVVVKETGSGISGQTARRLVEAGVRAIDVSGLGGTHWGRIEGARAATGSRSTLAAETFADWGIPTAQSVRESVAVCDGTLTEVWASGGVRTGLDAAKLISLGATQVGYAQPALAAALDGEGALEAWMDLQEFELRTALFCTGAGKVEKLREICGGLNA